MSFISTTPNTDSDDAAETEKATKFILDRLSKLGRTFWQYTEETGKTSTKSYEGLL